MRLNYFHNSNCLVFLFSKFKVIIKFEYLFFLIWNSLMSLYIDLYAYIIEMSKWQIRNRQNINFASPSVPLYKNQNWYDIFISRMLFFFIKNKWLKFKCINNLNNPVLNWIFFILLTFILLCMYGQVKNIHFLHKKHLNFVIQTSIAFWWEVDFRLLLFRIIEHKRIIDVYRNQHLEKKHNRFWKHIIIARDSKLSSKWHDVSWNPTAAIQNIKQTGTQT